MDLLAILALIISALVALSSLSKEWRERRSLSRKDKQQAQLDRENNAMVPIRGANEAVIALQGALNIAYTNEERLRTRIVFLEKENDIKEQTINDLEHRVWLCERRLGITTNEEGGN
jgi:hypothetical protein